MEDLTTFEKLDSGYAPREARNVEAADRLVPGVSSNPRLE